MKRHLLILGLLACCFPSLALCQNVFSLSGDGEGSPGDSVTIVVEGETDAEIKGYSICLVFDADIFTFISSTVDGTRGEGALNFTAGSTDTTATAGIIFSFSCPPSIPPGIGPLLNVTLQVNPDAPAGTTYLRLRDVPPALNRITKCDGATIEPLLIDGEFEVVDENPVCDVSPDFLDFGFVPVDSSAVLPFTIKNSGAGTLTGDVTESCVDYSIPSGGGPFNLGAGDSVTVIVRFSPTIEGEQECTIDLGSGFCGDVPCTGVGSPPSASTDLDLYITPSLDVPNPYRPGDRIVMKLPGAESVEVALFSTSGRRIRTLFQGILPSGSAEFYWDGRTEEGKKLGSGVYYLHVGANGQQLSRKILLIK